MLKHLTKFFISPSALCAGSPSFVLFCLCVKLLQVLPFAECWLEGSPLTLSCPLGNHPLHFLLPTWGLACMLLLS